MDHPEDLLIYQSLLRSLPKQADHHPWPAADLMVTIGKYFLDTPYIAAPLEQHDPEDLIVNLRAFDCFTFVETCLALTCHFYAGNPDWQTFKAQLLRIRYRGGILNGYVSRLHYFSDWLYDNACQGILQDITRQIGGIPYTKKIDYMTQHTGSYPALSDPAAQKQMATVEKALTKRPRYLLPLARLAVQERLIQEGDIIGIATTEEGLDVIHTGLAFRRGKTLHLLHASQQAGKVIVSPEPLDAYLRQNQGRTGILAGRVHVL